MSTQDKLREIMQDGKIYSIPDLETLSEKTYSAVKQGLIALANKNVVKKISRGKYSLVNGEAPSAVETPPPLSVTPPSESISNSAIMAKLDEILSILKEGGSKKITIQRASVTHIVEECMSDGKSRAVFQLWEELKEKGHDVSEGAVNNALAQLTVKNRMVRVRKGLYQKQ
jgi:predicted transcriptional regulator of viral defense system